MSSTDNYYLFGMATFVALGAGYVCYKVKQTDPAEEKVKVVVAALFYGVIAGSVIKFYITGTLNGTLAGSLIGGSCSTIGAIFATVLRELMKKSLQAQDKNDEVKKIEDRS